MMENSWSESLFVKLLQNHLEVDICQDLIVEHEGKALLDSGLASASQLYSQPTLMTVCCCTITSKWITPETERFQMMENSWSESHKITLKCTLDICQDLIVEHEGEALLDGGLGGQAVIQQAYLNDCSLLYIVQ